MAVHLRNPHSVLAALGSRPADVMEVRLGSRKPAGAWADVADAARMQRIPIGSLEKQSGRRRSGPESEAGRGNAGEAIVKERAAVDLAELFSIGEKPTRGLWLALDQVQDPHNVGAIFRTAAFYGVQGLVVTRDRSAPLTGTVYDVSSGGIEVVPFSVQTNLSRALKQAKESGLWVLGASEHAIDDVQSIDRDRPWLLVLGNEEKGLRRLTLDGCDQLCRLTSVGSVSSLNVSVAAGILMAMLSRGSA